jgi:hypothetical protein
VASSQTTAVLGAIPSKAVVRSFAASRDGGQ